MVPLLHTHNRNKPILILREHNPFGQPKGQDLWPDHILNSTILGLPVKSDWLRIKSKYSARAQKSELAGDLDLGTDQKDRGLCKRDFYPFVKKC